MKHHELHDIFPFDSEWYNIVSNVMENGGTLWVVERTDTNQFLIEDIDLSIHTSSEPFNPFEDRVRWRDTIPQANDFGFSRQSFYPTKELAERFAPKEITEGGCRCCGNGSKQIPLRLSEHEFVPSAAGQTEKDK